VDVLLSERIREYSHNNFVNSKGRMIVSEEDGKRRGIGMYFWD